MNTTEPTSTPDQPTRTPFVERRIDRTTGQEVERAALVDLLHRKVFNFCGEPGDEDEDVLQDARNLADDILASDALVEHVAAAVAVKDAEIERLTRIIKGYDRTPAEQRAADAEAEIMRLREVVAGVAAVADQSGHEHEFRRDHAEVMADLTKRAASASTPGQAFYLAGLAVHYARGETFAVDSAYVGMIRARNIIEQISGVGIKDHATYGPKADS